MSVELGQPPLARPIFVGGVSRSGTTVVGKHLLGKHPDIVCTKPAEMWFITEAGGLCDMAVGGGRTKLAALRRGKLSAMSAFDERMHGFWYSRDWYRDGKKKGLVQSVPVEQLDAALTAFRAAYSGDSVAAARQLAADLIDPYTRSKGGSRWVDTTPRNVRRADALLPVFSDLSVINMIRDGRDVAASIVSRPWGTNEYRDALKQWFEDMRDGSAAIAALPQSQVLTMQLEKLVGPPREKCYGQLLAFLEIADTPAMRAFFDDEMSLAAANVGRWTSKLSASEQSWASGQYAEYLTELERLGVKTPVDVLA